MHSMQFLFELADAAKKTTHERPEDDRCSTPVCCAAYPACLLTTRTDEQICAATGIVMHTFPGLAEARFIARAPECVLGKTDGLTELCRLCNRRLFKKTVCVVCGQLDDQGTAAYVVDFAHVFDERGRVRNAVVARRFLDSANRDDGGYANNLCMACCSRPSCVGLHLESSNFEKLLEAVERLTLVGAALSPATVRRVARVLWNTSIVREKLEGHCKVLFYFLLRESWFPFHERWRLDAAAEENRLGNIVNRFCDALFSNIFGPILSSETGAVEQFALLNKTGHAMGNVGTHVIMMTLASLWAEQGFPLAAPLTPRFHTSTPEFFDMRKTQQRFYELEQRYTQINRTLSLYEHAFDGFKTTNKNFVQDAILGLNGGTLGRAVVMRASFCKFYLPHADPSLRSSAQGATNGRTASIQKCYTLHGDVVARVFSVPKQHAAAARFLVVTDNFYEARSPLEPEGGVVVVKKAHMVEPMTIVSRPGRRGIQTRVPAALRRSKAAVSPPVEISDCCEAADDASEFDKLDDRLLRMKTRRFA